MPLDDRIISDLRRVDREEVPNTNDVFDSLLRRVRRRRARRNSARTVSALSLILIVVITLMQRPDDNRGFSRQPNDEILTPVEAPRELRDAYGITEAFRLARGEIQSHGWSLWAYDDPFSPGVGACVARLGIGHGGGRCVNMTGRTEPEWDLWQISSVKGVEDQQLIYGFTPLNIASVIVHHPSGETIEIPTIAAKGMSVRFFVGPPRVTYSRERNQPDRVTMRDMSGRLIDTTDTDYEPGEGLSLPRCGAGQYTPEIKQMWQSSDVGVTSVHITLILRGLRGSPLPCHLLLEAALALEDGRGQLLPIEGSGTKDTTDIIAVDSTTDFPSWVWRNWCSGTDDIVARVTLEDGRRFQATLEVSPSCIDPDRPSSLSLDQR